MNLKRLLANTRLLQGIPAPTFHEQERAAALRSRLEELPNVTLDSDPIGNLYTRLPGGGKPPLVISAHLDSVFPRSTCLDVREEHDRLIGPGIGDNALGLACLIELATDLGVQDLPCDVWLVANTAEEGLGNLAGMRAVVDRFDSRPSAYLVIEGMALGYIYHRGLPIRRYRISIRGSGGHAWVHAGRASALHALLHLGDRIGRIRLPRRPVTTLNIGTIQGGSSINTIAAEAHLDLEIRSETGWMLDRLDRTILRICESRNLPKPLRVECELIGERPEGEIPAEHPLVQLACQVTRDQAGITPELGVASTDASQPLSRGLPAICIGLTRGGNAHSMQEYIDILPITSGYSALMKLIQVWTGMDS
jgi:tripeptide aminopeptidase